MSDWVSVFAVKTLYDLVALCFPHHAGRPPVSQTSRTTSAHLWATLRSVGIDFDSSAGSDGGLTSRTSRRLRHGDVAFINTGL